MESLLYQSQLFQIPLNLLVKVGTFGFQLLDFLHHGMDVNRLFLLKSVNIARNVKIIVVLGNFFKRSKMTVFINLLTLAVSAYDFVYMLLAQFVLSFDFVKLTACIDKENVVVCFTAFLYDYDTSWNGCTIKDICRQTDNSIDIVFVFNEVTPNSTLCVATEQYTVRSYTSHCAPLIEVMNHVEDESEVGF